MVQVDYMLFGTGWCMVDALVYGTVDYRLRYRLMWLMHGSGYWYRLFGAG
jgi:hypothetical protein